MLQVENISKFFNGIAAVDGVSFSVEKGQVYGLLGPNGAGKTTALRVIMKIILQDSGKITFEGSEIEAGVKSRIGYLPEERGLYQKAKLAEMICYFASLKGLSQAKAAQRTAEWLDRFSLAPYADKKIEELSKGNQQKVQFVLSVIHRPDLVLLDEPFSGLDPVNQILLKEMIEEMKNRGATVLFSTHQMEQVEKLCDSICLINLGKVVLEGALKEIKQSYGRSRVRFALDGGETPEELHCFTSMNTDGDFVIAELAEGVGYSSALKELIDRVKVRHFEAVEPSLEQIFIDLVGGSS